MYGDQRMSVSCVISARSHCNHTITKAISNNYKLSFHFRQVVFSCVRKEIQSCDIYLTILLRCKTVQIVVSIVYVIIACYWFARYDSKIVVIVFSELYVLLLYRVGRVVVPLRLELSVIFRFFVYFGSPSCNSGTHFLKFLRPRLFYYVVIIYKLFELLGLLFSLHLPIIQIPILYNFIHFYFIELAKLRIASLDQTVQFISENSLSLVFREQNSYFLFMFTSFRRFGLLKWYPIRE